MQLTSAQIQRQDDVDNVIFELLNDLNPTGQKIDWKRDGIDDIRDAICEYYKKNLKNFNETDEQHFYPFCTV